MSDNAATDLDALERFVAENDDLSELEEAVGRFNIFDALRLARVEIRHSNFLAWLLDPGESHGQGDLFLKAVLMDLLREVPRELRPMSPVELDGVELRGVEVFREWRNLDLLIVCQDPAFAVAIENKVGSGEHGDQLERYEVSVREHHPALRALHVFLTVEGDEPSRSGWVPYTYAEIHDALDRCQRLNAAAIGADVRVALDHYLRLLRSRFMNDPKIEELCRRIYKNHRQALDLIFENAALGEAGLLGRIESLLREDADQWTVLSTTSKRVAFAPTSWASVFPPIGARKTFDPRLWIAWELHVREDRCFFRLDAWPSKEPDIRARVVDRLVRDPKEFGLRVFSKKGASEKWTRFGNEQIRKWPEAEEPDDEEVLTAIRKFLGERITRYAAIPAAVREALAGTRWAFSPPKDT